MTDREIRETLEKQLQLLSERSESDGCDLVGLTNAMCSVTRILLDP